jgi:hypothetical protein
MGAVNYVVDPYGVFHSAFFPKTRTPNERVMKIDYLNSHQKDYNAFMLGSSAIGTTNPRDLDQYQDGYHFYNLTCSSANLYDFRLLTKYLLTHEFDVKEIYLQIDLTNLREFGKHQFQAQKHHYAVTDASAWKFYLEYLTIFPFADIKEKLILNFSDKNSTEFDIEGSGMWFVKHKDRARQKDMKAYLAAEDSFKIKNRRTRGIEKNFPAIMQAYQDIVTLCAKKGVKLTLLTTAYNHVRMDAFEIDDTLRFIEQLVRYHDIWYFSGYNSITNDDSNYYEVNHYVGSVGALKAARIYHDKDVVVPKDFGVLLTQQNIKTFLKQARENMQEHDRNKRD